MTFQLAMVAKNGWIMASDTLENRHSGARHDAIRETVTTRKITHNLHACIVHTVCGDQIARNCASDMAQAVMERELKEPLTESWIKETFPHVIGRRLQKDRGAKVDREQRVYRKAIFIFRYSVPIWEVLLEKDCLPTPIYEKCYNGDKNNSAKFFTELYYERTKTVMDLLPLAACTVVMAGGINPSGVNGLEIVFCQDGKVTEWHPNSPEIEGLRDSVIKLDADLRARLTFHSRF